MQQIRFKKLSVANTNTVVAYSSTTKAQSKGPLSFYFPTMNE